MIEDSLVHVEKYCGLFASTSVSDGGIFTLGGLVLNHFIERVYIHGKQTAICKLKLNSFSMPQPPFLLRDVLPLKLIEEVK